MKNTIKDFSNKQIIIIKDGIRESVAIEYERGKPTLHLILSGETRKTYTALDLYDCFGLLRADFVYPSAMASQISSGVVAYETEIGNPDAQLVRIFDYEENELTNDINEQIIYRKNWAKSLRT